MLGSCLLDFFTFFAAELFLFFSFFAYSLSLFFLFLWAVKMSANLCYPRELFDFADCYGELGRSGCFSIENEKSFA